MENFEALVLPIILILFGIFLGIAGRPRKIRWLVGYRTSMSMKNQATWEFANSYAGKMLMLVGVTILPFSIRAFVDGTRTFVPGVLGVVQMVFAVSILFLIIIFTEAALRKEFDENGERRK